VRRCDLKRAEELPNIPLLLSLRLKFGEVLEGSYFLPAAVKGTAASSRLIECSLSSD
jgi:hypothetical protein